MFLFPACGFSVPFLLEEEFSPEASKQSLSMFGGVETHTIVVDPAIMNSKEMSREPSLWANRSRDLLPQLVEMLGGAKWQAPTCIHQIALRQFDLLERNQSGP